MRYMYILCLVRKLFECKKVPKYSFPPFILYIYFPIVLTRNFIEKPNSLRYLLFPINESTEFQKYQAPIGITKNVVSLLFNPVFYL